MTQDTRFQPQGLFPGEHRVSVIDSLPKAEEADRIRDVIIRYNAHLIKYFGGWAVEDLPA